VKVSRCWQQRSFNTIGSAWEGCSHGAARIGCNFPTSPTDWGQQVNGALEATVHFALSDELSGIHWSKEQRPLIWTVKGVFTPFRGHCSGTDHQRATSRAWQKYRCLDRGREFHRSNHPLDGAHEGGEDIENSLWFTLPYLLFILLQNFTRTIANLHIWAEHRGTKQQQQQHVKYFSSKKA